MDGFYETESQVILISDHDGNNTKTTTVGTFSNCNSSEIHETKELKNHQSNHKSFQQAFSETMKVHQRLRKKHSIIKSRSFQNCSDNFKQVNKIYLSPNFQNSTNTNLPNKNSSPGAANATQSVIQVTDSSNKNVLCKNCGLLVELGGLCRFCNRTLTPKNVDCIRKRNNEEVLIYPQKQIKSVPSNSFYNQTSLPPSQSQFQQQLKMSMNYHIKPKSLKPNGGVHKKNTIQECITISSDDDEDVEDSPNELEGIHTTVETTPLQSPEKDLTIANIKQIKFSNQTIINNNDTKPIIMSQVVPFQTVTITEQNQEEQDFTNTPVVTNITESNNMCEENDEDDDLKLGFNGIRKLLCRYPPDSRQAIEVTTEDSFCLNKDEFLNDVIIEFYLKYIYLSILSEEQRNKTYIFSSFFYKSLCLPDKSNKELSMLERRHNKVKKWTRNVDLFSKDFIFIPINEASHWFLAVICFPGMVENNATSYSYFQYACKMSSSAVQQETNKSNLHSTEEEKIRMPESNLNDTKITVTIKDVSSELVTCDQMAKHTNDIAQPQHLLKTEDTTAKSAYHIKNNKDTINNIVSEMVSKTEQHILQNSNSCKNNATVKQPNKKCEKETDNKLLNVKLQSPRTRKISVSVTNNDETLKQLCRLSPCRVALKKFDPEIISQISLTELEKRLSPFNFNNKKSKNHDIESKSTINDNNNLAQNLFGNKEVPVVTEPKKDIKCSENNINIDKEKNSNKPIEQNYHEEIQDKICDVQERRQPCILIFDSLRGNSKSRVSSNLREYLTAEWSDKKKSECGEKIFTKDNIKMCTPHVPQQDNYSDCGIFLLHYVESFFKKPIKNFITPIKHLENWFSNDECEDKREQIQKIISDLHLQQHFKINNDL